MGAMTRLKIQMPFSVQHVSACGSAVVVSVEEHCVSGKPALSSYQTDPQREEVTTEWLQNTKQEALPGVHGRTSAVIEEKGGGRKIKHNN